MARPVYATTADYQTWTGTTPPADIASRLSRASRRLDRLLVTAVYDVGDDGAPTDTDVAEAFRDAVCALTQSLATAAANDDGHLTSVSAGSVSMTRDGPNRVLTGDELPPDAVDALSGLGPEVFRMGVITGAVCSW